MSKITREETLIDLDNLQGLINGTHISKDKKYFANELIANIKQALEQPQLSDDVEEALMYVIDGLKCNAQWSIYKQFINTIKQKLQAQASEIERLKEQLKEQEQ